MGAGIAAGALPRKAVLAAAAIALALAPVLLLLSGGAASARAGGGGAMVAAANREYAAGEQDGTHNAGGEKYWRGLGFESRVEWCACFVSWCADECGLVESGLFPKSASVVGIAGHFRDNPGKGAIHDNDGSYVPKPGDIAIWDYGEFDYNGNGGRTQHVAIVERYDAERRAVCTIEGNSGDMTAKASYPLGTSVDVFVSPAYPSAGQGGVASTVEVPQDIEQAGFTVTCYDEFDGRWTAGTLQRQVCNLWHATGALYDDGIAAVDGRLLVACTAAFGAVGDRIDFELDDGTVLECIVADAKSASDPNCTEYGHEYGGRVNIIEFEVDSSYYRRFGNPGSGSWKPEWTGRKVVSAANRGSVWQ